MTGAALRQLVFPTEGEARGAPGSRIHPKRKQGDRSCLGSFSSVVFEWLEGFIFLLYVGSCSEAGAYLQIEFFL